MDSVLDQLIKPTDPTPLDWDARITDTNKRTRQGVKLSMREVRFIIELWGLSPARGKRERGRKPVEYTKTHGNPGRTKDKSPWGCGLEYQG